MKPIRNILLTLFLTIAVFSAVVYTACNKNKCAKVVCMNHGVCYGGGCVCPIGFEGLRCEVLSRDKFVFTYNGGDVCGTSGYRQYPITLLKVPYDSIELTMKNVLNDPDDSAICTLQSADSFYFQGSNNSTSYYGTGKLSNDSLWLYYSVRHDTTAYSCKYFGQSLR